MRGLPRILMLLPAFAILLPAASAGAQREVGVRPSPGKAVQRLYGGSWAVLIGINRYQNPRIPRLRYAVNDAKAIERALLAQGFRQDRIITLTDDKATKAAIERLLGDELRQQVGADDRLLVFFAGHGKTDQLRSAEDEGYLVPVDGDPGQRFSTAISMTALRFVGGVAMADYGAPAQSATHALDAVRTAMGLREEFGDLSAGWEAHGLSAWQMGIGIHTGTVFAGSVGRPL